MNERTAFKVIVGARYKLFRLLLGESVSDFASEIGVTEHALASFEGGRRMLSVEKQHDIAYKHGTTRSAIVPEEMIEGRAQLVPLSEQEVSALKMRVGARKSSVAYRQLAAELKRLRVHDARTVEVTYQPRARDAESAADRSPPEPRKK